MTTRAHRHEQKTFSYGGVVMRISGVLIITGVEVLNNVEVKGI